MMLILGKLGHFLYWFPFRLKEKMAKLRLPAGVDFKDDLDIGFDSERGYGYNVTDVHLFRRVMRHLTRKHLPLDQVKLFDVGAGKGALLFETKKLGVSVLGGVELSDKMFAVYQKNAELLKIDGIELWHDDATQLDAKIDKYNTFFLFNPFGENIMRSFLDVVVRSAQRVPRKIFLLYYNPTCAAVVDEAGFQKRDTLNIPSAYRYGRPLTILIYENKL